MLDSVQVHRMQLAPGGRLIPFTKASVPAVSIGNGFVVVIPPAEVEVRGAEE